MREHVRSCARCSRRRASRIHEVARRPLPGPRPRPRKHSVALIGSCRTCWPRKRDDRTSGVRPSRRAPHTSDRTHRSICCRPPSRRTRYSPRVPQKSVVQAPKYRRSSDRRTSLGNPISIPDHPRLRRCLRPASCSSGGVSIVVGSGSRRSGRRTRPHRHVAPAAGSSPPSCCSRPSCCSSRWSWTRCATWSRCRGGAQRDQTSSNQGGVDGTGPGGGKWAAASGTRSRW